MAKIQTKLEIKSQLSKLVISKQAPSKTDPNLKTKKSLKNKKR